MAIIRTISTPESKETPLLSRLIAKDKERAEKAIELYNKKGRF